MSMTPGPWKITEDELGLLIIGANEKDWVATLCGHPNYFENDAHLIAAAPDMLHCLKQVISFISGKSQYPECWPGDIDPESVVFANTLSVIAKAEGKIP